MYKTEFSDGAHGEFTKKEGFNGQHTERIHFAETTLTPKSLF